MLIVATQNTKITLSDAIASDCLSTMLNRANPGGVPDVWAGQEWGPNRNDVLEEHGTLYVAGKRQTNPKRALPGELLFVRHTDGGPPMGFSDRFRVDNVELVVLAAGRRVRPQAGTRGVLGDNDATLVTVTDAKTGDQRRILNLHFDAHVEDGKANRYRDPRDPRAAMHRAERRAVTGLGVDLALGDTNWHDLELAGLVSCWHGRTPKPTLGGRAIDTIYARGVHAAWVRTYGTPAREHKLVVAGYPR